MKEKVWIVDGLNVTIKYRKNMKNIYLRISDTGGIIISAPPRTKKSFIEQLIKININEITKRLAETKSLKNSFNYQDGESYYLWGEKKKLRIVKGNNKFYLDDSTIVIETDNAANVKKIFRKNIRMMLLEKVKDYVSKYSERMGVSCDDVRIKKMKTRWGTCNITKRRIWINEELAKYPLECLEHVVVHELVHLLETNHTKRFYSLVEKYYPQYKESEMLLKQFQKKVKMFN